MPADHLPLIHALADAAGEIARQYFRAPLDIVSKADESPVTIADKEIEKTLRAILEEQRPDDGILGEEFGVKEGSNNLCWVIDPIDGTKPFTTGRPSFGTLIALCRDGVPILGCIDQPILKERWIGGEDVPATLNGQAIRVAPCPSLGDAKLATTAPEMFVGGNFDRFTALKDASRYVIYGGDCYSYGALAAGWLDVVIEADLGTHDYCALAPIITAAGGFISDWNGNPLTMNSDGRVIAIGDGRLKDQILNILR